MNKILAKLLTAIIVFIAVCLPILISFKIACNQSLQAESDRVFGIAKDILRRSELTADQVNQGFLKLAAIKDSNPCSASKLVVMQENDLASSYIQAFGFISDGKLICSSLFGFNTQPVSLGPVDYVSLAGVAMRSNVTFQFIKDTKFIVLERQGYAAIINKELPVDAVTVHPGAAKAVFNPQNKVFISSYGAVKKDWINKVENSWQNVFQDGNNLVAIIKSRRYQIGAVATLPISYVHERSWDIAKTLLPMGIIAGLLLAAAMIYIARVQKELKSIIKIALKRGEFYLVYQPIVELSTGKWVGAEALIRWRRPNGEVVRPDLFIPVAEESGLIKQITLHVMELFAKDAKNIFSRHPDFHIGINLSSADLETAEIIESLKELKAKVNAGPKNILVEVTERGFLKTETAQNCIKAIRNHGIDVAIDDFGTGYSSLSYLERFELDYLKVDKSFVDTVGAETATSHVVRHIIEMAKSLELQMIAEGVETEAQAKYLKEHGVQFAQGWLFAKPMPFDELITWLNRTSRQSA